MHNSYCPAFSQTSSLARHSRRAPLWVALFLWVMPAWSARAQDEIAPAENSTSAQAQAITNASPRDWSGVTQTLAALENGVARRDVEALRRFGWSGDASKYFAIGVRTRLLNLAVSPSGALARQSYEIRGAVNNNSAPLVLKRGTQELALTRLANGNWSLTGARWEPPAEAAQTLSDAAREEWQNLQSEDNGNGAEVGEAVEIGREEVVLHLVAERRGGRWIGLRRSRWTGHVLGAARSAAREAKSDSDPRAWIVNQLARRSQNGGGTLHLLMQRGARGWVGLDSVWQSNARPNAGESEDAALQSTLSAQREAMLGADYLDARAHFRWAQTLTEAGLFGEAADEWEKTAALAPASVSAAQLQEAATKRASDPAARAVRQLQQEGKVGLVADHPKYVIDALAIDQKTRPTPLRALRIGLEYSKLGDDARAASWLGYAERLLGQNRRTRLSPDDAAWIEVLHAHLVERKRLALLKPQNSLRSALFTVRCRDDDEGVLSMLAALEAAQHTVYGDFKVPMGATEVVLWRTQSEFQSYTSRFSNQGASEFVAALTLTKLISTDSGPMVLGEEVNAFIDPRIENNVFGTVAHEYGHVAVRQVSRGRNVPVWFNEGIATVVEGGYDGAINRVRRARGANKLLSMNELREWNVDGERAFVAYSQANSMIDFLIATWGADSLLEILRQIGGDVAPEDAFKQVLGISTGQFWSRWRNEGIQ